MSCVVPLATCQLPEDSCPTAPAPGHLCLLSPPPPHLYCHYEPPTHPLKQRIRSPTPLLNRRLDTQESNTARLQQRSAGSWLLVGRTHAPATAHSARVDATAIASLERTQGVSSGALRVSHSAATLHGAAATAAAAGETHDDHTALVIYQRQLPRVRASASSATQHHNKSEHAHHTQLDHIGLRGDRLLRPLWSSGA